MDVLLIAGLWLDGSAWDDVVPALEELGPRPAVTMPGPTACRTWTAGSVQRPQGGGGPNSSSCAANRPAAAAARK
jgi:hypothetical protein